MKMEEDKQKKSNNVLLLGLVSLFTDLSSQMIYPLLPEFLVSLGASKSIIGVIEGIVESAASVFRSVFGKLSDKLKKRKLFILAGYTLSTLSKPFLFFANVWPAVLAVKFTDRIGKATREASRDALISVSVDKKNEGFAFGVHRALDRVGAAFGPLLAILILKFSNDNIRLVFLASVIPGIISVFIIFFVKEIKRKVRVGAIPQISNGIKSTPFIIFLIANIIFTLGHSSNAFIILKAREVGVTIALIPLIWTVYSITSSVSASILGKLSDKTGRKPIIIISFIYYAVIYFLFGITKSTLGVWLLFAAYGIYYGLSEGIFRAYIADLIEEDHRATAYGVFNTGIGIALLPASIIMGVIWDMFSSQWAFFVSAGFSILGFILFISSLFFKPKSKN